MKESMKRGDSVAQRREEQKKVEGWRRRVGEKKWWNVRSE